MKRSWLKLRTVTPLMLGMIVFGSQLTVMNSVMLAQVIPTQGSEDFQNKQNNQNNPPTEAQRLYAEGERLRSQGTRESLQQAIAKFQQALALFRSTGDSPEERLRQRYSEAATLNNIGNTYSNLRQPQQALDFYQQSLILTRELGLRNEEATNLSSIGRIYAEIRQPQQALNYLQQALVVIREVGNQSLEANTLNSIGFVYSTIGQLQQALTYYQQALSVIKELGNRSLEATSLNNIGVLSSDIGQPQQALSYLQQSLAIIRELGNSPEERLRQRPREAGTLNNLGLVYGRMGQLQQALTYYQQSLVIIRELGDRSSEATSLNNIGLVYSNLGQLQQALTYLQQSLPILREVGDRAKEAATLSNIAVVYTNIGQPQQALSFYQQALPLSREVGDRSLEATTLNNLGNLYSSIGQPRPALDYFQQSLPILREVGNRPREAGTLNNIGDVYNNLGQPEQALDYLQQALPITREVGDRLGEATTLSNIGGVYRNINQPQQALTYFQQAFVIYQEVGDRSSEARTLSNLALAQETLNNIPLALQSIQAAIAIVEEIRGQLINPEFRTSYFATVQEYYQIEIDLLMQLHTSTTLSNPQQNPNQSYAAHAFNVTERSKARTLLELLTESKANIRTGVDPQLLAQEQELQRQLGAIDKRRIELANTRNSPRNQIADLETQRTTLQNQYRNLQSQIRATSPKYAALNYPQPLNLAQIQQQILDDNTVILTYSLGRKRSYLWLVSKTEMTSYQLPPKKIIEDLVNKKVRPQLTNPRATQPNFFTNTAELSNILLQPVLEKIGNKRIVVIGDGALQYVPFGALPDTREEQYQPLLVNNEVVYLPSVSTLQTIRNETRNRPPAPKTLAVLADPVFSADDPRLSQRPSRISTPPAPTQAIPAPPLLLATTIEPEELPLEAQNLDRAARNTRGNWSRLPGTRRESDTILNLVPTENRLALFDFQANRENALSNQLSQYRFIHWATHGFVNAEKPELSGIIMSLVDQNGVGKNGYLLLGDIFNLSFNADMVVLSACETGLGEVVQGEGLIGLTRGFMYAGTPRVVTSLWAVADEETATLMGNFYTKILQQNKPPAEALRTAQLEMYHSKSWVAPYYWAAFTLQGEWR